MPLIEVKDVVGRLWRGADPQRRQHRHRAATSASSSGRTAPASRRRSRRSSGCSRSPPGRSSSMGDEIANSLPDKLVPLGPELRAAGKERLHLDDGRGEPRDGRLHPARRFLRHARLGLRHVPGHEGEAPAAGGRALGRAAPDGGDGPGADEQAEAADARRAVGRAHRRATCSRSSSRSSRSTRPASAS